MSGIYIPGMEMPKNCMLCSFCVEEADPANGEMCLVTGKLMPPCNRERLDDCPLVPVPDHGRLIDADALLNDKGVGTQIAGWGKMYHETAIEYAPTIIPASGGDAE